MAAFLTDCLSVGLEILHLRCQTSIEAKEAIQKSKLLNKDGWVRRVTFSYENATHNSKNPFTNFGSHTTHIFSYNYIQVNHDLFMQPIVKRLNKTDFKLLAWRVFLLELRKARSEKCDPSKKTLTLDVGGIKAYYFRLRKES
jgi:hypothetical protein